MLRVQLLAPQIEEAIAQALLFGDLLRAGDLKRQRLRGRQHVDRVDDDLHRPVGSAGLMFSCVRAMTRPATRDHAFELEPLRRRSKALDSGMNTHCVTP